MKRTFVLFIMTLIISCGANHKQAEEVSVKAPTSVEEYRDMEEIVEAEEAASTSSSNTVDDYIILRDMLEPYEEQRLAHPAPPTTPNIIFKTVEDSLEIPTVVKEVGRIVYDIPKEMVRLSTYKVEVKIARDTIQLSLVPTTETTVNELLRTSSSMQVELKPQREGSFQVVSQSPIQFIEPDEHSTWVFYITPLETGTHYISVVVSIIKNGNLKQTVYDDNVKINTNAWVEAKHFFKNEWKWLFLVVLVPIGKYIYSNFIKK